MVRAGNQKMVAATFRHDTSCNLDPLKTEFEKLGDRVMQVDRDNLGIETALLWLNLSLEQRAATGVIAPTWAARRDQRDDPDGLVDEGTISGPAGQGEKLVLHGLTRAQMAVGPRTTRWATR
ncbi:MAG: hypothetical protein M2R45_01549 [Verrucomicrobia subdivision 3 bacterium]|nr:hypothetical protein [Limisphaerales bacterium]MCS1413323.1 hypothetical protein [Limisphaerales bacterium]